MGITISIISAIIKSVVSNKISDKMVSEIIGISLNGGLEKVVNAINDFIYSEKSKVDAILSEEYLRNMHIPEDHILYVIGEMKWLLSKIESVDELLDDNKYDAENLEKCLWNRYYDSKNASIEYESDIKIGISAIAGTLVDIICNSDSFERDILIKIYTSVENQNGQLQEIEDSVNNIAKENEERNTDAKEISRMLLTILSAMKQINPQNRALEYAKKWNQNMFLNDFDEADEDQGERRINVSLREVYPKGNSGFHLPRFTSPKDEEPQQGLENILADYINNSRKGKMLLILGQQGIGKSTLVTWIAANYIDIIDKIFIYKFADDLEDIKQQDIERNMAVKILNMLHLSYADLKGKTLIIDGFDEISVGCDKADFLNAIYWNCRQNGFSVIITCRENYINRLDELDCDYIKLRPWNREQIQSFCRLYEEKVGCALSDETMEAVLDNEKVFGMPLILYMVLTLEIDIKDSSSIIDVYDRVFDVHKGIYQRYIDKKRYGEPSRSKNAGEKIHLISMKIAFWIFENNPEKGSIPWDEYEKICEEVIKGDTLKNEDVLIGNYFEQIRQENSDRTEICFIHSTIYEYFVTAYICSSIEQALQKSEEELAGVLGKLFKQTALSNDILDFLRIKIKKSNLYKQFDLINGAFGVMLRDGMTYHTGQYYKNAMKHEMLVFTNMLNFICLWDEDWSQPIFEKDSSYIRCNEYKRCLKRVQLQGIDLRGADLREVNFESAHLEGACLNEVNLREANLRAAYLEGAKLQRTNLRGANLFDAKLTEAKLQEADLVYADLRKAALDRADLDNAIVDDTQLEYLDKIENLQNVRVYLTKSKQIVSYDEYCKNT